MANTGLLILTNPTTIIKLAPVIRKSIQKTLYIHYLPEKLPGNHLTLTHHHYPKPPLFSQTVSSLYMFATSNLSCLDIKVLLTGLKNSNASIINTKNPVDLVIFDKAYSRETADSFVKDYVGNKTTACDFILCEEEQSQQESTVAANSDENPQMYKGVVLGGTFDRLHNGHKIFLSRAVLRCTEKLTVGVTDTNMITGKLLWELIEPCSKRILNLQNFLEDIDSSITYDIVPITDIYGPTKHDPTFDLIVVSEETKRGADKINSVREQNNLNKLDVHVVKLAQDQKQDCYEESKISSSNYRMRLLGTRLQEPDISDKPLKPYIIGLTGGIASGKSSVAEKLQKLGAGLVNCDKIAHDLYLPGKSCFNLIVEKFGKHILRPDGFIDRKILGDIVFHNKDELNKLNELVWPEILKESKKEIQRLHAEGFDFITLEAAVLIQANWKNECHEIWTCIIPPEEAVKRVKERNALTEEEAKSRIEAQPSNSDQVREANVVICTLWSPDFTLKQVQKAWAGLQAFVSKVPKS